MKNFSPNLVITSLVIILIIIAAVIYLNRFRTANNQSNPSVAPSADLSDSGFSPANEYYNEATISGTPVPFQAPLTDFVYPGATVKNQSGTSLELETEDDEKVITDWYKAKIEELEYNAKSFAQTTNNGIVFNKLSAAKPAEKIEITIKKDQTTSKVVITVDRS